MCIVNNVFDVAWLQVVWRDVANVLFVCDFELEAIFPVYEGISSATWHFGVL